jgi:hypothetical protein
MALGVLVLIVMDVAIEGTVLRLLLQAPLGRRGWIALALVNALSVSSVFLGAAIQGAKEQRLSDEWQRFDKFHGDMASMTVCDLDGDNQIDIIVARPAGAPQTHSYTVHSGLGNGEFGPAFPLADSLLTTPVRNEGVTLPLKKALDSGARWSDGNDPIVQDAGMPSDTSRCLFVGDVDGDARVDTIAVAPGRKTTALLCSSGKRLEFPFRESLRDAVTLDVDGTPQLLLLTEPNDAKKRLRSLALTPKGLVETFRLEMASFAQRLVTADLDGNGADELLVNVSLANRIEVFTPTGKSFARRALPVLEQIDLMYARDLNGDGRDDLIASNSSDLAVRITKPGGF